MFWLPSTSDRQWSVAGDSNQRNRGPQGRIRTFRGHREPVHLIASSQRAMAPGEQRKPGPCRRRRAPGRSRWSEPITPRGDSSDDVGRRALEPTPRHDRRAGRCRFASSTALASVALGSIPPVPPPPESADPALGEVGAR